MPIVPDRPRLLNVATPFTAVAVAVPTRVPPEDTDAVTTVLLSDVTALPARSLTVTCGWVVKAVPVDVPTDARDSSSRYGLPADVMETVVAVPCMLLV